MILVTGATGTIGGPLVRILAEAGAPFRALVRDEAKGRALGCPFVVGDLDDPASLPPAFEGVDRLLLNGPGALPVAGRQPMIAQQGAAIEAALAAGVSRVVKISAWRPSPDARLSPLAHWEIERHLADSGLPWATLQPTGFYQNFDNGAGGLVRNGAVTGPYGDGRVAYIDAADIAACAAALLTGERGAVAPGAGVAYPLTGPLALSHAEIADALGVAFHDQTPSVAGAELRAGGLPAWFVDDLLWLYADLAAGGMSEVTTAVRELTGHEPRSLTAYLRARTPTG
ncbi:NAD(P)H-binding protein [Streptomyces profundus]|uniref:NmrA family NAD(P)-binding protein n=1 Tax=Streptomyces profundus TaxID=2867410 RepID=UPI001D1604C5|nr:NAD(P)H-binding protein [Streptomyces sp. MA3_2.13]UED82844.1 NAD(P)H-binding protein [Streptomyces sp. MA3_2.13]